jgi:hypothetical protein
MMQIIRFFTAFTLAATATAIALDADASPREPAPRIVTAAEIESAVDQAQAMANQVEAHEAGAH